MAAQTKIIIDNVGKINLGLSHDVKEQETTRKVSLSLEIEENQFMEILRATALNATWSIQLTVVSKQLPLGEHKELS